MACQSQRGLPWLPTNDHISSISASASPARSKFQATSAGFRVRSRAVFTDSSPGAFFLSARSTVLGQICRDRAVSRPPLALRRMSMIMQALHCPNCQGTNIIRHGTTRQGKQRYRCQEAVCNGGTFLVDDTYPGHSVGVKQQIVDMAMNASGIRDTARVLHISPSTVIKALKKTRVAKLAGGSLLQASRDTMLDRDGSADAACAADDGSQDAGAAPARSAAGRGQAPPP